MCESDDEIFRSSLTTLLCSVNWKITDVNSWREFMCQLNEIMQVEWNENFMIGLCLRIFTFSLLSFNESESRVPCMQCLYMPRYQWKIWDRKNRETRVSIINFHTKTFNFQMCLLREIPKFLCVFSLFSFLTERNSPTIIIFKLFSKCRYQANKKHSKSLLMSVLSE